MCMEKLLFLLCMIFNLISCSNEKSLKTYPIIDVVNNLGNYQKVYCSDIFSSIELIPLETSEACLLDIVPYPTLLFKDGLIFMSGNHRLYAFDRTGKFLNQIGERGQGPGEYQYTSDVFFDSDKLSIYIEDMHKIIEYDFTGKYIRSFPIPIIDGEPLSICSYVGDNVFIGEIQYNGKNKYKYFLFNQYGDTIKCFPNHIFFDRVRPFASNFGVAKAPMRVNNLLFLKDNVNDTIYVLSDSTLQPAFVFGLGKYTFPKEYLENHEKFQLLQNAITFTTIMGMPNYFFYRTVLPESFSGPKSKPVYNYITNQYSSSDRAVYGLYNIKKNTNILLDSDEYLQKGFINDINGGLSIIPRFYVGNNIVVDVWYPEEMKEMLTEEYFANQKIKDSHAHQKLKEILKNLKEDDNPVVVVAKLK